MIQGRALRGLFSSFNKSASRIGDFTSKVWLINSAPGLGFFLHSCTSCREYCRSRSEAQKAAEIVYPSVVNVTLSGDFGEKNCYGIIMDSDGTVVTFGGHLRSQSKEELSKIKVDVHLNPRVFGHRTYSGALSYVDFVNNIAIVNCDSDEPLPSARIGNSENLHIGDMVVFLSTANGEQRNRHVQFAAEWGTIIRGMKSKGFGGSALKNYMFPFYSHATWSTFGGAVINHTGELVGVHNYYLRNYNCATSIELVCKMMEIGKKYGIVQPWLGVDVCFGIDFSCFVRKVTPGSPAHRVGIRPGFSLNSLDGIRIRTFTDLYNLLMFKVGMPLTVTFSRRDKHILTSTVVPEVREHAWNPFL